MRKKGPNNPNFSKEIFCFSLKILSKEIRPTVILALCEAVVGGSSEVRSSRTAWSTWQNPASIRNIKISWVWWHMLPRNGATREAEEGESLEPGRRRLQ